MEISGGRLTRKCTMVRTEEHPTEGQPFHPILINTGWSGNEATLYTADVIAGYSLHLRGVC